MDNHEKLKTAKTFEITLNRREGPFESISRTLERLKAGELAEDEIERIRESFTSLARDCKADQQNFLQSRGFPPDLVQAVRLAMADLFGTFATTDEIEEFAMDKVWDLLQTAFDRRQWLAKIDNGRKPDANRNVPDADKLPFGLQRCDVPRWLRRPEFDKPIEIPEVYSAVMEALMASAPNAVTDAKKSHLKASGYDTKNAPKKLRDVIDAIGLTVENWTLKDLKMQGYQK